MSLGHRSGDVDDVRRRSRFAQNWCHGCVAMALKPESNHPNKSVEKD